MANKAKYKAKPVFWDSELRFVLGSNLIDSFRHKGRLKLPKQIIRFDSQHEFKVYLELCRMYGAERVGRQFRAEIIPPGYCYPNGKNWKIDFAVSGETSFSGLTHYVEAKGAFLPEFAHTLASFEAHDPVYFERLIVVFTNAIPKNNKIIESLLDSPFKKNLLTLEELKQLKTLP